MSQQRPVYIMSYHSPMFPAHWALWIPSADVTVAGKVGKLIHVEGDARGGFRHEFKRNYDLGRTARRHSVHLIGWTNASNITDSDTSERYTIDTVATDIIERYALEVAAPGPSLRSGESNSSGSRSRVQIQNCQTWMRLFIAELVERQILTSDALVKVDAVPKN